MALSQLPVSIMEATLFSSIVYPMVGFHASPGFFLTFWLTVASSNLCLSALFRCDYVSLMSPSFLPLESHTLEICGRMSPLQGDERTACLLLVVPEQHSGALSTPVPCPLCPYLGEVEMLVC